MAGTDAPAFPRYREFTFRPCNYAHGSSVGDRPRVPRSSTLVRRYDVYFATLRRGNNKLIRAQFNFGRLRTRVIYSRRPRRRRFRLHRILRAATGSGLVSPERAASWIIGLNGSAAFGLLRFTEIQSGRTDDDTETSDASSGVHALTLHRTSLHRRPRVIVRRCLITCRFDNNLGCSRRN